MNGTLTHLILVHSEHFHVRQALIRGEPLQRSDLSPRRAFCTFCKYVAAQISTG